MVPQSCVVADAPLDRPVPLLYQVWGEIAQEFANNLHISSGPLSSIARMKGVKYPIPREKIVCPRCGQRDALLWTDKVVDCKGCGIFDEDDPNEIRAREEIRLVG